MALMRTAPNAIAPAYALRYRVTAAPAELPVTVAELKTFLRIDFATDDGLLDILLAAAVDLVEAYTGRAMITRTLTGFLDQSTLAPEPWWDGVVQGSRTELFGTRGVILPQPPLASVVSISTFAEDDAETTFNPVGYFVDLSTVNSSGRIILRPGAIWPSNIRIVNSIKFVWTAGYGAAADVPGTLKDGVKMVAAYLYNNRGDACCEADASTVIKAAGASLVLWAYKLLRV